MKVLDPNEMVKDVLKGADNLTTTREEYTQQSTDRLLVDTTSPFKLPHLIRPILGIWVTALYSAIIIYGLISGLLSFKDALEATAILVGGVFIFYFGSRGFEKVTELRGKTQVKIAQENAKVEAKKTEADIKITELNTKAEIKRQKKIDRQDRRSK
jgi:hypothetical protein